MKNANAAAITGTFKILPMMISVDQILEMPHAAILAEQLTRALEAEQEKLRHFYEIVDEGQKMEFINGEIIFHSPTKLRHITVVTLLTKLLHTHVTKHSAGYVGSEKMLVSLTRNDYEPDICFFERSKSAHFTPTQMQYPAPDFVVEVLSDSTIMRDRTVKFEDYSAHEIKEYWIVDPERETIEQFALQNGVYELFLKSNNGEIKSVVLPDFAIPVRAVFDEKLNLEVLGKMFAV